MAEGLRNQISGGVFFGTVVQGQYVTVQLPAQVLPALSGMPAVSPAFTGRSADLDVLLRVLDPAACTGGTPTLVSVAGMAGVGKTELAVQAAHAALDRGWFPGGVLFVDMFGYDQARRLAPEAALDQLLRALGMPAEHIPPDGQSRARLYASTLAEFGKQGRRVLVVIDNAFSAEQARPLLPTDALTSAIITSRHTLAGLNVRLLDLGVLNPVAAVELLGTAARTALDAEDARIAQHPAEALEVARLCGFLPLALRIVAALLTADPTRPVAGIAADLAQERSRLDELRYADLAVGAAFELSFQHLSLEQARIFGLLPINPGPDIATVSVAVLAGCDERAARHVLEDLTRAHLVEHSTAPGRWRMHDLVRLFAGHKPDGDGAQHAEALDRLLSYYLRMTHAARRHLQALPGMHVPEEFADRAAALLWLDSERATLVAAASLAAATGRDLIASDLPNHMSGYLDQRRYFDDKIIAETISRAAARRLRDRRREANALNNLGVALVGLRRFEEAIAACTEAVALHKRTHNREGRCIALNTLGIALRSARRFDEAIAAHQQAVRVFRRSQDRHTEGKALNNLGNDLQQVRRFEEAIAAYTRAVVIYRQIGDRHRAGRALGNLGGVLRKMHRSAEAIAAAETAALLFREVGDLHGEGGALNNLGLALIDMERYEDAIVAHENAIAIFSDAGDRHHEALARTHLGMALGGVGRSDEGIAAHEAAAVTFRETGDRHGEGIAVNNLGVTLRQARRFDEAIAAHQQAAAIFRETQDRQFEGAAIASLGLALYETGRPEEAIAAHEAAASIFRETGDRHAEGRTLTNLAAMRAAAMEG